MAECPVEAIFPLEDVPDDQKQWIQINAEKSPTLPIITDKQPALPTADARKKELGF